MHTEYSNDCPCVAVIAGRPHPPAALHKAQQSRGSKKREAAEMFVASDVAVTEQDPEEAQRADGEALDIYCDALLALNEKIAAMVEAFAPKHDPKRVRASAGTDSTRATGAGHLKGVAVVQELILIVKAYAAIEKFAKAVAAATRMLNKIKAVGARTGMMRLQPTLSTLQTGFETYDKTLRAAELALPVPDGRPDMKEQSLSLQRSVDAYALTAERDKFLIFLDAAYLKYMKVQGGGSTPSSYSLAATCSQDGEASSSVAAACAGTL